MIKSKPSFTARVLGLRMSVKRSRLRMSVKRSNARERVPLDPYWAHRYFTDGDNLYRFVGWVSRSVGAMVAEFEDCETLAVLIISVDDLSASGLRPIIQL